MALCKLTKAEKAELESLIAGYEQARAALGEKLDILAGDWEEILDEKSDTYRDSEAGQQAQERADQMRAWFDELPDEGEFSFDLESVS